MISMDFQEKLNPKGKKMKKVLKPVAFLFAAIASTCAHAAEAIEASKGLGYVMWIIIGIGSIVTVIMAISTGFAFRNDSANAKAQLVGTVMIPILIGIVIYLFKKLGVELTPSSSL